MLACKEWQVLRIAKIDRKRDIPSMPPRRLLALAAPVALSAAPLALAHASEPGTPSVLRCKGVSNIGCSGDICIADRFHDRAPITFRFKTGRYRSARGSGRITQAWDMPDGRHAITVSSPPASGEFTFSKDWREASAGGSIGYACTVAAE